MMRCVVMWCGTTNRKPLLSNGEVDKTYSSAGKTPSHDVPEAWSVQLTVQWKNSSADANEENQATAAVKLSISKSNQSWLAVHFCSQ